MATVEGSGEGSRMDDFHPVTYIRRPMDRTSRGDGVFTDFMMPKNPRVCGLIYQTHTIC